MSVLAQIGELCVFLRGGGVGCASKRNMFMRLNEACCVLFLVGIFEGISTARLRRFLRLSYFVAC